MHKYDYAQSVSYLNFFVSFPVFSLPDAMGEDKTSEAQPKRSEGNACTIRLSDAIMVVILNE